MQIQPLRSSKTQLLREGARDELSLAELKKFSRIWLDEGRALFRSPGTVERRRIVFEQLFWYLERQGHESCGKREIVHFLAYFEHGHTEAGGRWGNPALTKPVRPRTVHTVHGHLRAFFNWCVDTEECLDVSPMARIPAPSKAEDAIQPFSPEQVKAMLNAAKRTACPSRDEAILRFLLDTGARASELVGLKIGDLSEDIRSCTVLGKGNKRRTLFFGRKLRRALLRWLADRPRGAHEPLFPADRSTHAGDHLTRSGLQQIVTRIGRAAGVRHRRLCPHTFRHTFAYTFLQAGGQLTALQAILGHTHPQMSLRYNQLVQGDAENQHRVFSPGDRY